uniref:SEFIR domain-containing protein n=1 Tax=Periophthalmus magnuspinnatus TaxID=409849 RepID=A0A3B4BM37_9GOBI
PGHADSYLVVAVNIPLPPRQSNPSHTPYKYWTMSAPRISDETEVVSPTSKLLNIVKRFLLYICEVYLFYAVLWKIFMSPSDKVCAARLAVRYKKVGPGANGPCVPVLVVYPAKSEQFQCAVGALVEFLQQYGGCSVAVDMWQQGSVAKLGPMRWLLEQVQAARTVLIVAAQPSSLPSPQPLPIPGASIPAAAQDLYPLALNLVAGQAKNSSDLAKFWVTFSLMKDLNKLCRCLHKHKQDDSMKIANLFSSGNLYSRDSTEKLRAAVQALNGQQVSGAKDQESLAAVFLN